MVKMIREEMPREECASGWLMANARWAGIIVDNHGRAKWDDDVVEGVNVDAEFQRWEIVEIGMRRQRRRRIQSIITEEFGAGVVEMRKLLNGRICQY